MSEKIWDCGYGGPGAVLAEVGYILRLEGAKALLDAQVEARLRWLRTGAADIPADLWSYSNSSWLIPRGGSSNATCFRILHPNLTFPRSGPGSRDLFLCYLSTMIIGTSKQIFLRAYANSTTKRAYVCICSGKFIFIHLFLRVHRVQYLTWFQPLGIAAGYP